MCLSADENDPDYGTDGRLVVVVDGRIEEPWGERRREKIEVTPGCELRRHSTDRCSSAIGAIGPDNLKQSNQSVNQSISQSVVVVVDLFVELFAVGCFGGYY